MLRRLIRTIGISSCGLFLNMAVASPAEDRPRAATLANSPAASGGVHFGPDTTRITAPLNTSGYPDYLAALNEQASSGIAQDENFWALMWKATGDEGHWQSDLQQVERELGITIPRDHRIQFPQLHWRSHEESEWAVMQRQWDESMRRPWTRDEFPRIAGWVDAKEEPLRQIHAACQRPKSFSPLLSGDSAFRMIEMRHPHVAGLRGSARLLASRSMLRLGEGDREGAWQDLLDLYQLARHCEQGPTLYELLVSYWCRNLAQEPMAHWVSHSELTADELLDRLNQLDQLLQTGSMERHFESERYMFLDTVLAMTTGQATSRELLRFESDPPQAGYFDDEPLRELQQQRQVLFQALILAGDAAETLRYGNTIYDEIQETLRSSNWSERKLRLSAIDARFVQDGRVAQGGGAFVRAYLLGSRRDVQQLPARVLMGLLLPRVAQPDELRTTRNADAATLRAAILRKIHLLRSGQPSSSIAELDPSDDWNLIDPFAGTSLRMRADERGVVIYSIGPNGVDDQGFNAADGKPGCDDPRVLLPTIQ